MKLWEIGLTQFWMKNLVPRAPECFTHRKSASARQVPIYLGGLSGAFLILGLGFSLGTLTFLVEMIISNRKRRLLCRTVEDSSIETVIHVNFTYKILVNIEDDA